MILVVTNCYALRNGISRADIEAYLPPNERDWPVEFRGTGDSGQIQVLDRGKIYRARHRHIHLVYTIRHQRIDRFLAANADRIIRAQMLSADGND